MSACEMNRTPGPDRSGFMASSFPGFLILSSLNLNLNLNLIRNLIRAAWCPRVVAYPKLTVSDQN